MRSVLVALAVVLAGCPALGPQSPAADGGTVTPDTYPPGVTADGVIDPATLADAHVAVTENASYTVVSNRTIRYTNGSLVSRLSVRLRLAADRQFHVRTTTGGPDGPLLLGTPPAAAEYWSNGSVYVRALTREGRTTYNRFSPPDTFVGTWRYWRSTVPFGGQDGHARETIHNLFSDVPTALAGTASAGTTTVYRLAGEGARDDSFAKAGSGPVDGVTVAAEVTEDGLVRRFDLSYVTFVDGHSARVNWTLSYLEVGNTTAPAPEWFDRAVDSGTGGQSAASLSDRSSGRLSAAGVTTGT
jgi:hypothetical protein